MTSAAPPVRASRGQHGTSLTEVMIVVAILGIVAGIAALSVNSFLGPQKIAKVGGELQSAMALARMEAVKRGLRVSICGSSTLSSCAGSTDWSSGWVMFAETDSAGTIGTVDANDTVLRVSNASVAEAVTVTASVDFFTIGPLGLVTTPATGFPLTVDLCRQQQARTRVSMNISGLVNSKPTGSAC